MGCVFSNRLNGQTLGLAAGNRVLVETSWRAVVRVLRSPVQMLDDVVNAVVPGRCRCCEGPLLRAGMVPVCDACVGRADEMARRDAVCGRCCEAMGLGIDLDLEDIRFAGQMAPAMRCRACRLAEPGFEQAVSYGDYDGELRALIQLLKFDRMEMLADALGERLARAVLKLEGVAGPELLVVAVPLFGARQRERGYNQSVLLADRALARLRKLRPEWRLVAAHGVMRRTRRTEAQYVLSQRERRLNLRGAFAVVGDVAGREVLVLDDIMTSGATARECARVLKAAGAAKVWVATVARAQRHQAARVHEDPGEQFVRWDAKSSGQ